MPITNRPADSYIDDLTAPAPHGDGVGGGTAWFAQLYGWVKQFVGALFEASATLASDSFSPVQAAYVLTPESGATDNLATIGAGYDGMVLRIRPATSKTITVKNAGGGAGQILTADAADFVMADPTMRMVLIYSASATAWIEEDRMYGGNKAAFTAWLNAATSSLAGIIKAASIATTRTGTATDTAVTPDALASLWQKGADIASATTLTKPADANLGGYHVITGTTQVQNMWAGTLAGESYWFECAAALPVKNGSNLVTKTGADMTFAAGDRFEMMYFGSSVWKMILVNKADGSSLVSSKAVPVPQTVLSGPVDSNGLPNFGGSTGGTTVTASGTIVATAANGFATGSAGPIDRVGSKTNPSWSGLSVNGTMYLYVDVNADGTLTEGSTTLAPVYQLGGAYSVTNGQFTYNIQERVGKVGNGATAVQNYRVFVGEVTVAGGVVSAITWYALMGRYVGPWIATAIGGGTSQTANHNIGTTEIQGDLTYQIKNTTTDVSYAVGDVITNPTTQSSGGAQMALVPTITGRNTMQVQTLGQGLVAVQKGGAGNGSFITAADWSWRMTADRKWP